jgi:hypothetical protein
VYSDPPIRYHIVGHCNHSTKDITHTPHDRPERVNCRSLAHTALALTDLLR